MLAVVPTYNNKHQRGISGSFNLTLILTYSLLKLVFIPEVSFCPELLFISEVTFTRRSNFFVSEIAFYL